MNIKSEILKRLSSDERDFPANLAYGIKLWNSSSFYYMSKYDITFDFFLDNLGKYFDELKGLDEEQFTERWQIVNTFLRLPCPSNALPATVVKRLKQVLGSLTAKAPGRRNQLLESLTIVAFDGKYRNFYKFDFQAYCDVLKVALEYYKKCLKEPRPKEEEEKFVDRFFNDISIYHKSAANDPNWRTAFDTILTPLSEVVLLLERCGVNRRNELLDFFQQVYFTKENVSSYNRMTDESKSLHFMGCFEVSKIPLHVMALLMEGFLRAYRELHLEILLFLKYYLQNVFVEQQQSILNDAHQVFTMTKYVFSLLRKYFIMIDQRLLVDFNFTGILTTKLKELLDVCLTSEPLLRDFLSLVCTINDYNPLILEQSVVNIILKVMFVRKEPETLQRFQEMLVSTINMFVKLNKHENLRDELFMQLGAYLDENDLDETIRDLQRKPSGKRKSVNVAQTPTKKRKLTNGTAEPMAEMSDDERMFWELLFTADNPEESKSVPERGVVQNLWPSLTFAWPDINGQLGASMKQYTKQLLTKRSLSYWRSFVYMLNEIVDALEHTESTIFQLEMALCWMCYFFAGNTLVEHTNLFWAKLNAHFEEFDDLMTSIARRLLLTRDEGDSKIYGAFLNTVYFYSNYRLMVHYYRPDSIEESNNDQLFGYLNDAEWQKIEERASAKDIPMLNRVLVQKLRLSYFKETETTDGEGGDDRIHEERRNLIVKIMNDRTGENFRSLLLDRSTNVWFLGLMDKQQRQVAVEHLLDPSYCPLEDMRLILAEVSSDHELFEVFLKTAYKKMSDLLVRGDTDNAPMLQKIPFEIMFEPEDGQEILPKLKKMFKNAKPSPEQTSAGAVDESGLKHLLDILDEMRVDSLASENKSVLVAVHMLLLAHLNSLKMNPIAERFRNQLTRIVSLGTPTDVSPFITIEKLVALFGLSSFVMVLLYHMAKNVTEQLFEEYKMILGNFSAENDTNFELLLIIYNLEQRSISKKSLTSASAVPVEQRNGLLVDIVAAIDGYLLQKNPLRQRTEDVVGFNHALKACSIIIRHKSSRKEALDDQLREHILAYVEQALLVCTSNADILLTKCLAHKDFLQLDDARVVSIKEKCWETFLQLVQEKEFLNDTDAGVLGMDDEETTLGSTVDEQTNRINTMCTSLVVHFSEEEYMEKLNLLNRRDPKDVNLPCTGTSLKNTLTVFTILAKRGLKSSITNKTCEVFVRSFATVVSRDVMGLCVTPQLNRTPELVETILECFATIISRHRLVLFPALLDYVLQFLSAIDIGKRSLVEGEETGFYKLHRAMSEVMYGLLISRTNFVASRLPSYLHVYQGLVGSIICFKGNQPPGKSLNSFEILTISDLLLPLERIIGIAKKKLEQKLRTLAPYAVAQVVHAIVQCKRPTTQQDRIAGKVYKICFDLIAIYDPHATAFLLRAMDESSRLLFTSIMQRYNRNLFSQRKSAGRAK